MGLMRNQLSRRFRTLGLLSDAAMVAAAGRRVARRSRSGSNDKPEIGELLLAVGAAYRILRRLRRRRRRRRGVVAT